MLNKVVLTFESVVEIQKGDHLYNESCGAALYYCVKYGSSQSQFQVKPTEKSQALFLMILLIMKIVYHEC